jgi:hypothetical protein
MQEIIFAEEKPGHQQSLFKSAMIYENEGHLGPQLYSILHELLAQTNLTADK